jgi:RNA polymerase sigma-70 factor (ECF subfamily)
LKTYTELEIVNGCARNERIFQEILYRRHFPTMMHMCMRFTNGDKDRAMEIVNDGFLRVFKKIHTFEFKGSLEGWIRRLIFHAISDYFKSNQRYFKNIVLQEEELTDCFASLAITEGVHSQLNYMDLLKLFDDLPPSTRQVFTLFAVDGYQHDEIAEQLNISVGTSKWHVSAAREKLKERILNDYII